MENSPRAKAAALKNYQSLIYQSGIKPVPLTEDQEKSKFAFFEAKLSRWLPDDLHCSWLDLGCGQGYFLKFLRQRGYRNLTGIDISPEQIQSARQTVPSATLHQMNLFEFISEKSNCYDCITALDVIEHLDKESVLTFLPAVWQALKPGGRVILQTPNAASPWGMEIRYGDFTHECCFTPRSLRDLLTLVGFTEVSLQPCGPTARNLSGFIRVILSQVVFGFFDGYNLIETGSRGDRIYTRVFQGAARKPAPA